MQKNHTCKILAVGIIVLFIGVGIYPAFAFNSSTVSASVPDNVNNLSLNAYKSGGQIESGFMIGIMHVKHIKKGWGWEEVWTPIYIIIYGQNGKRVLRPSSGSFTPYDIDGFLGPIYYLLQNPYLSGPFFIYADVIVWEEL